MKEIISKIILQSEKKGVRVKLKRYKNINKKCNDFLKEQKNNHIYFTINNKNNKNNKLISKQFNNNNKSNITNISVP